jgi:outer membrane lipoprotein
MKPWLLGALALVLAGCATTVPEGVRQAPPDNPALGEVRANPEAFSGRAARWGGSIASVHNRSQETCIEVVGRPLQANGRPYDDDRSEGRFLACVNEFLDPAIYSKGRLLTVSGSVEGAETRPVGDFPYRYPRLRVADYQLWAPLPERRAADPFWDPYWDPFWHGPWPYRYPHPFYAPRYRY